MQSSLTIRNLSIIRAADRRTFRALGKGDIKITLPNGWQNSITITFKEVYYSPIMAFTLISVSCIDRAGFSLIFGGGICKIKTSSGKTISCIPQVRGLYHVTNTKSLSHSNTANITSKEISISELHQRIGHVNHEDLRRILRDLHQGEGYSSWEGAKRRSILPFGHEVQRQARPPPTEKGP